MSTQELVDAQPSEIPAESKWTKRSSSRKTVCEVASRVLDVRLKSVCSALQLAAEKSEEDVEHVHQLRIAARRANAGIRVFRALIPEAELNSLRDRLRRIRQAADEARNWDVMAARFSRGEGSRPTILEQIQRRRRAAQGPIVAVHQEIETEDCRSQIDRLVQEVESNRRGEGKRRFGRQASRYLAPVVKKFFKAAESDLTTSESLHTLRIRAKKVRYTMEITAAVFDTAFRKRLYRQVTLCQDLLGTINDHATARELFGEWLSQSEDVAEQAFLEGWLLAEQQAADDLRSAFLATWTPKVVVGLKKQFTPYC